MLPAGPAQDHNQDQHRELHTEADHASARSGKKERADGQKPKNADDNPSLFPNFAKHQGNQCDWKDQLDESGKVIAIHVRTKRDAAVTHFAKPVEFPIEGQLLEDPEDRDQKAKAHDEPDKGAPSGGGAEYLSGKEKNYAVGDQEIQLHARVVSGYRGAKQKLPQSQQCKPDEWEKERRDDDFLLLVVIVEAEARRPENEQ